MTFDIGRCLKIAIPTLASIKNPQLFGTLLVKTIEPIHIYSPIDIHLSAFYRKKRKLMETGYNKIYIYYICTYIYIYYINYIYILTLNRVYYASFLKKNKPLCHHENKHPENSLRKKNPCGKKGLGLGAD